MTRPYTERRPLHRLTPGRIDMKLVIQNLEGYLAQWYPKRTSTTVYLGRASVSAELTLYVPGQDLFFLDTPNQVHRIKVDELNGFFITTSRTGGLIVSDIDTGKTLWNLPNKYAHLEYENGYLVFDRPDWCKGGWRSESVKPQEATQDDSRIDRAQELYQTSPRFVPHALVPIPILTLPGLPPIADHTRAYRMVYPNLLGIYHDGICLGRRTMQRVQTVDNVMNLKASGAGRNIPEGSYTGRRWWDLLPEAIAGEGWEDTDEEAGAQDVDMDMGSYAAAALDYAQKETVVPTSERSVGTEHPPETNFPAHQPFASVSSTSALRLQFLRKLDRKCTTCGFRQLRPLSLSTDAPGSLGFVS
ncbi:hypothetical protein BKA70DRAFT_1437009 [Coprinopsis sp. MPI-PUGE-AT-0042]|nr:hypothetical protein BKA70DRAFT_1437009 [Coprinopsis sp. MPI-PUGE-AT-0042]